MSVSFTQGYKRYATLVLLIAYLLCRVDAGIFVILMQPIKLDLALSDTELGLLAGPALLFFYAILGVPVARWADRSHRINIMSGAIALWSMVVMLTSMVSSLWQLALARVGVGIGEAGFSAVAQSVIADYHTREERTRAISTFMLAISFGAVTAHLTGGWVNQAYGWRTAFLVAGLPGLIVALLLKTTVQEPRRHSFTAPGSQTERPSLREVWRTLWRCHTLRHLLIGQGVANIAVAGIAAWLPAFLIRAYGLQTGELGTWFAVTVGPGAAAGIWLSGYLSTRFRDRDERIPLRLMALFTVLIIPVDAIVFWHPSKLVSLWMMIPVHFLMVYFTSPMFALVQDLSPKPMRATMASLFILVQLFLGGILGVSLLGVLSDLIEPHVLDSAMSLRWSVTIGTIFALWGSIHFWLAARTIRQDLGRVAVDPVPEIILPQSAPLPSGSPG